MEFFEQETQIDFLSISQWTGPVTILLSLLSLCLLSVHGLNFGLDFTGGTQIETRFQVPVDVAEVRDQLEAAGFVGVRVQSYGSTHDLLIRAAELADEESVIRTRLQAALDNDKKLGLELRKVDIVGSEVGAEMAEQGAYAVLIAIVSVMIYIAIRFERRLAISAALGLCHDALVILGLFSITGIEFELSALAAILAILGYSLNDTIVVFDRIRENVRKRSAYSTRDIINASINQTLSRTIMTSVMTSLVIVALLVFGGSSLFSFSFALGVGIVIGTYSSIFVSGALALKLGLKREHLLIKRQTQDYLG